MAVCAPLLSKWEKLGAQEWRDSLFLRYGINSPDLLEHCDTCGSALSIFHTLDCKKGGLITACQNDLHDEVADLAGKAFTPMDVRDNTKIFTGRSAWREDQIQRQGGTAAGQGGSEGGSPNPGPLDAGD